MTRRRARVITLVGASPILHAVRHFRAARTLSSRRGRHLAAAVLAVAAYVAFLALASSGAAAVASVILKTPSPSAALVAAVAWSAWLLLGAARAVVAQTATGAAVTAAPTK